MRQILKYVLVIVVAEILAVSLYRIVERPKVRDYSDPQIPVGKYDELVSVDVIRAQNDIWVVDHNPGHLIFELNREKKAGAVSFMVFAELLDETSSNEVDGKSSASYLSK